MVCHPWHGYPYQNNTTVIASSVIVSPFVEFAACKVTDKSQSAAVLTVVAAGLDCGACCGQTGEVNARVLASILNDPGVRQWLAAAIRLLSLSSNQAQISAMINKSLTGCRGCAGSSCKPYQTGANQGRSYRLGTRHQKLDTSQRQA